MKKYIAILFIILTAVPVWHNIIFYVTRSSIRMEMSRLIAERKKPGKIITLKIPRDNHQPGGLGFRFVNGKEIMLNGDMYDIISSRENGTERVLTCVHDKKETALLKTFASLVEAMTSHDNSSRDLSFRNIIAKIIQDFLPDHLLMRFILSETRIGYLATDHEYKTEIPDKPCPPPRLFL